jgi:hypothetical protein
MSTDVDHERLRQLELGRKQGPEEGADETEACGDDEPAADPTSESVADDAAGGRDDDERYEPRLCDGQDGRSFRLPM